jgi:23S rRNA (adenine2503-C2)-methyltransferase
LTANTILLSDLTFQKIEELVKSLGASTYRGKQLTHWLYRELALSFDEMTDLPKSFRESLAKLIHLHCLKLVRELVSRDGTIKVLFALDDGNTIESVLMPYLEDEGKTRYTLCVSTQVGCAIKCAFCATGQQSFERNLSAGEIIDQVLYLARKLKDEQEGNIITNLVFMGMGEPLANYDNVWQSIVMLNSPDGFMLGARNITISTSGLIPGIKSLSREKIQVNLAVSLHASKNSLRNLLVPINNKYPLEQLIKACRDYITATGRRISFEYILFEGINDSLVQARSLAHLVAGLNCHVNLIVANKTASSEYHSPSAEVVTAFEQELKRLRITCTARQSRGLDINAGCGQLRSRHTKR